MADAAFERLRLRPTMAAALPVALRRDQAADEAAAAAEADRRAGRRAERAAAVRPAAGLLVSAGKLRADTRAAAKFRLARPDEHAAARDYLEAKDKARGHPSVTKRPPWEGPRRQAKPPASIPAWNRVGGSAGRRGTQDIVFSRCWHDINDGSTKAQRRQRRLARREWFSSNPGE